MPNFTPDQFQKLFPNASKAALVANTCDIGSPKAPPAPKGAPKEAIQGPKKVKVAPDSPKPVKTEGTGFVAPPAFAVGQSTDEKKLNKTEAAYLALLRTQGHLWLGIQCVTLKLADDCRFTPDFAYINHEGRFTLVDVKGFQREDALIKAKVAARLFPWASFVIVSKIKGGWDVKDVNP